METKICIKCETPKKLEDFDRDIRLKCGRKGKCKLCYRDYLLIPSFIERRKRQYKESVNRNKEKLTDNYVIRQIVHHTNLKPDIIRLYPELIQTQRTLILINRKLKENGKNNKC